MARSSVVVNQALWNAEVAVVKDAVDIANDHSIDVSSVSCTKLTVLIEKSDTKLSTFTFKAGDYSSSSQGDLVVTGGAGSTQDIKAAVKDAGASAVAIGSMAVFQGKDLGVLIKFPSRKSQDELFE